MGSSVINSSLIASYCQNFLVTKLNAIATQMDVEDSSTASAPAASEVVLSLALLIAGGNCTLSPVTDFDN